LIESGIKMINEAVFAEDGTEIGCPEWSFKLTYFLWPSLGIEALEATSADSTR
jgi:hypothetical protein